MTEKIYKYFISYGHEVKYFADAFYYFLLENGIDRNLVFKDDKGAVEYGSNKTISESVASGIDSSEYFFPIVGAYLSDSNYEKSYIKLEIDYAIERVNKGASMKILPVKINEPNVIIDKNFGNIKALLSFNIGMGFDVNIRHQGLNNLLQYLCISSPREASQIVDNFFSRLSRGAHQVPINHGDHGDLIFHNRDKEKQEILEDDSKGTYHMICAPPQYGKTRLLCEIEKKYKEKKWVVYNIFLDKKIFNIEADHIYGKILGRPVQKREFINKIIDEYLDGKKGVVFLFDLDNNGCEVQKQLITKFMSELIKDDAFEENIKNNFRLISTSRIINGENGWPSPYNKLSRLSEFEYNTVKSAVLNYLENSNVMYKSINTMTARIFLISGGHPGCVKRMVDYYIEKRSLPKNDIKSYSDDRIADIKKIIHPSISLEFEDNAISVFRYIDIDILKHLNINNANLLYDRLRQHGIYQTDFIDESEKMEARNMVMRNSILRRVYVIRRCFHKDGPTFLESCDHARQIYLDFLKNKHLGIERSTRWLIEYWFSKIQKKLFIVLGCGSLPSKDVELDMRGDVLFGINLLLKYSKEEKTFYNPVDKLKNMLSEDWEFKLMLNFRSKTDDKEETYDERNFDYLIEKIDEFCCLSGGNDYV